METSQGNSFKVLFPRYSDLAADQNYDTNENIELFIRNELPLHVENVRKIEATFNAFLNQYTNLIVKRPQMANLSYSLASRATQLLEKHMKDYELKNQKLGKEQIGLVYEQVNPRRARESFREQLAQVEGLIRDKYLENHAMSRESEEEVACALYTLVELFHFAKGDLVSFAAKHQLQHNKIAQAAFRNEVIQPIDLAGLMCLDPSFGDYITNIVNKRCRPFINKRDFFNLKIKQILKESESKVEPNLIIFVDSLLSKQRHRITKLMIPQIQAVLRNLQQIPQEKECKQIGEKVEQLKRKFMQVKNNPYFIDILRGSFSDKYKMQLNKIENLYYLNNLEKYLQDVYDFMESLLAVEGQMIDNRRRFKSSLSQKVESELYVLCSNDEETGTCSSFQMLVNESFDKLRDALERVTSSEISKPASRVDESRLNRLQEEQQRQQRMREERDERERQKKQELEAINRKRQEKEAEERLKRQQAMNLAARKKQEEEDKKRREREEQQKKYEQQKNKKLALETEQRKKRQQQKKRADEERKAREKEQQDRRRVKLEQQKAERERRQQQSRLRQQQVRRKKEEERRQKQQRQLQARDQEEQKIRDLEMRKKKEKEEEERRRKQQEQQRKRREDQLRREKQTAEQLRRLNEQKKQDQERRKAEEELQRKRQAEQQKEREQRLRRQAEQQRKARERREKQEQQRRKKAELDRKREDQQRQLQESKRRQDEEKRKAEDKRKQEQRQRELKRREEEQARRKQEERKQQERMREEEKRKQQEKRKLYQKKRQQEQKKRRLEEQNKRAQEQKRREEQERKRQQKIKEEEQQRIRAEDEKKKKQAEAAKVAKKNDPPKKSAINYAELEDDELVDQDADIRKPATNPGVAKKQKPKQQDQYLPEYDDDFDPESPEKQGQDEQGVQIEPKKLIDAEGLKSVNEYLKGSSYARKNKQNVQVYSDAKQYDFIFEEFTLNKKMIILEPSFAKAIFNFSQDLSNESKNEQQLKIDLETIQQEFYQFIEPKTEGEQLDPRTKLIFPFSFANELNICVVEVNLIHRAVRVIFKVELAETDQNNEALGNLISAFEHVFELDQTMLVPTVVSEESRAVLETFDKELPNLLILFVCYYEQNLGPEDPLVINQYTVERFFYIRHTMEHLYKILNEEAQSITEFYSKLTEKFTQDEKIRIHPVGVDSNQEEYNRYIAEACMQVKQEFLANTTVMHELAVFEVTVSEGEDVVEKIDVYMSMSKGAPKPALNYFIVSKDEEDEQNQSSVFEWLTNDLDDNFETTVYMDYTRHNGLTEYSDFALPLWAHMIQKKKMAPVQAFRALTLSFIPFYAAFKQMD